MGSEGVEAAMGARPRPKVIIVGVGHVFDIREPVRTIIRQKMPDIVALELDGARFSALQSKQRGGKGDYPFAYQLLARFQRNLAEDYGSEAGSEMVAAAVAASEIGARIALIDMDALLMFKRLIASMSLKERVMMAFSSVGSLFVRKKTVEKELERFNNDEEGFMKDVEKFYPSIARVLIDERNQHMVDRLRALSQQSNLTLAIVGDGHVSGMSRLVSEFADVESIRLSDLRQAPTVTPGADNSQMTLSFTLDSRAPGGKV